MPGLQDLRVSLTKNGYFKVSEVIKRHPASEVLDNINGVYEGINLDRAQILKMLSGDEATESLPSVWDDVRAISPEAVDALTFLSIIYSHYTLIHCFKSSISGEMRGTIKRSELDVKVYTNLIDTMDKMKLGVKRPGAPQFIFDLKPVFKELKIGPLAKRLLYLKLQATGWKEPRQTDYFSRDFYDQCFYYEFHKALGLSHNQFKDWLEGNTVEIEEPPVFVKDVDVVNVSGSLVTALTSKPFAIMSGSSGTGKTQTVRNLVHELCPKSFPKHYNHVFVPVEAGWTDGRHLVGFRNPFGPNGEFYNSTPVIELLLRANYPQYSEIPFFVVLDEMNLSYVEMYFSRFLSLMEASYDENPEPILNIDDLYLLLNSNPTAIDAALIQSAIARGGLFLTRNVFIVGTVNVDETTHMFSPKVLDRAYVLEFKPCKPSDTDSKFTIPKEDLVTAVKHELWTFMLQEPAHNTDEVADVMTLLDSLWDSLGVFKFGPRVTNECRGYVNACLALKSVVATQDNDQFFEVVKIKDRIICQKVLPKLNGNKNVLLAILNALAAITDNGKMASSNEKIKLMIDTLNKNHFTNFFA